jgi:multiple sugar transport system ATP-binding protein
MTLADRIAVLRAGKLLQVGTPREVYERPANSFVGAFLGTPRMNLLPARAVGEAIVAGTFRLPRPAVRLPAAIELGVRAEHVAIGDEGERGEIVAVEPLGAQTHVVVRVGDLELHAQSQGFGGHARGDTVRVAIDPSQVILFDAGADGDRVA